MLRPFYITTAIDYANGSPHLGHAYEKVLTDVISRHLRMSGRQVHFLTGLDEHGQKVQQTALKRDLEPQVLVDEVAAVFQRMLVDLDISHDDYIRTTEPRHQKVVQQFLQKLFDQGLIYRVRRLIGIRPARSNSSPSGIVLRTALGRKSMAR